ncbi:LysE family translocator [Ottowia testudinis]|uniref:LysE family translocator n=1 Tax=Ottowia testudinis TaxID=2816950 RepID=A0A975CEQ1_9BURK|nr:LysE family translocator [Ottowia testudinis]QTD45020.1 LysE family translocator [Ottowia testudinis]
MPDTPQLLLFVTAGLLLNITPGPDAMFIVANAVRAGARAGVVAALGISAGCLVHVAAAALGVSALLVASSAAFGALKWAGAIYLVWVGVQMLRSARRSDASISIAARVGQESARGRFDAQTPLGAVFRRGFLTNVLNPKVALFFLAFVPQFIAPGTAQPAGVFLALGLLFSLNGLIVCICWALAAAWAARRAGAVQRATRWLDGVAGGLFVAFGIQLAWADAPGAH